MRKINWYDYLTVNIYWLGLTTISQTMSLVQPLLVQEFVGPARQGTFYGSLRLFTLMVALLVQALMGMLSDRSRLRWGRRRPFVLVGTLLNIVAILAIGASTGYWMLFAFVVFSQVASNIAHGAQQGLIPDLVPEDRRGRFSGVKAIMELLPVILVSFTVARLIAAGQMWNGILVAVGILFAAMVLTMLVREEPLREPAGALEWKPFVQLGLMTAAFTLVTLGAGTATQLIGRLVGPALPVPALLVVMGIAGLAAMVVAVVLGVWISVRISIGSEARQYPGFAWWVISRLAFLVGTVNLSGFAVYFLQGRLGLEREAAAGPAARLMMVVGLFILLCAFPSGWLADRIGRKPLLVAAGLMATMGTLILIAAPGMNVIFVGGCLVGAATGVFFTTNWALGTDLVPKDKAGRYLGISNLAGAGAGAVGAYIGGPIADLVTTHVPGTPGLGYVLVFGIYAALFFISTLALIKVREKWVRPVQIAQV